FCILVSFTLYVMAGREIFQKREQLRAFSSRSHHPSNSVENPFTSYKMTEVHITSELAATLQQGPSPSFNNTGGLSNPRYEGDVPERGPNQYSVNISSAPLSPTLEDPVSGPPQTPRATAAMQYRNNKAALEANTAAWGYTKVALLFFISLLVTWVSVFLSRFLSPFPVASILPYVAFA
ncbi:MAG: hypothetical protein Q9167_004981, partial [Letrouitia subvulpina]